MREVFWRAFYARLISKAEVGLGAWWAVNKLEFIRLCGLCYCRSHWEYSTYYDGRGKRLTRCHLLYEPGHFLAATEEMADCDTTASPWANVKQVQREVKYPKFCNSFFYKVYFKENVRKLISKDYPAPCAFQPGSKIMREEEDDEFTVSARFDLAWKLVEDLFVGKWDEGYDEKTKYSSQLKGEVVLFDERVEGKKNQSHSGFIIGIKATDPTVHPALFKDKEGDDIMQNQYTLSARAICEGEFEELREDMFDCKYRSFDNNSEELLYFNVVNSLKA